MRSRWIVSVVLACLVLGLSVGLILFSMRDTERPSSAPPDDHRMHPYSTDGGEPYSMDEWESPREMAPRPPTPLNGTTHVPATVPSPPDPSQFVTVLYATNRIVNASTNEVTLSQVTNLIGPELNFGVATVRIPEEHNLGEVEQPGTLRFFWIPVMKEKENEKKHFTLAGMKELSEGEFAHSVKEDGKNGILIYVHGFSTGFSGALFKIAQIKFDTKYPGLPIAFSWPSQGGIFNYDRDADLALASRDAFEELLRLVSKNAETENIHIVAHSMGSRIVTESLNRLRLSDPDIRISELVLGAPDISNDVFAPMAQTIASLVKGITIYASAKDVAMFASRLKSGGDRIGDIPSTGPLLFEGIETIDVSALGQDVFELNHGTFSSDRSVLDDLGRLLRGVRPPHERSPQLKIMPPGSDPPKYWRYPD